MLPFLQKKPIAGLIIAKRKADGGQVESHEEGKENEPLEDIMTSLLRAVEAKDTRGMADAIKEAFEHCDKEPHVEGEHIQDEGEQA